MSLLAAREAVMRRFRPSLQEAGITEQQWRTLRALSSVEEAEVTELARMAALLPPSLSRILKEIEARGLVARRPAPEDMRRSLISITAAGRALIDQVAPASEAVYAEIEAAFGPDRLEELYRLLRELAESVDTLPEPGRFEAKRDSSR